VGSRLLRRSGVAVAKVAGLLNWRPKVVFQVGIGVHYQEVDVMRDCWPNVKFVGCEAHPELIAGLEGKYPGTLFGCAIGNMVGEVLLNSRKKHKDGASLYKRRQSKDGDVQFTVPITTLDKMFPDPTVHGEPILLWLDCEGSELAALQGGVDFLKSVDVINIEMTNNQPSPGWCGVLETHCFLAKNGFVRQTAHTNRTESGQCDAVYVREYLFRPEYCTCPISLINKECYLQ